jgi:PhoH-like ATPase
MKKNYVLDTNALLEDPNCITVLRNGEENGVAIPLHVILELDKLKRDPRLGHLVAAAVDGIFQNLDNISLLRRPEDEAKIDSGDMAILREIRQSNIEDPILVTNDRILQIIARMGGVQSQEYKSSHPFQSDSQLYTGFVEVGEEVLANSFQWIEGKPVYHSPQGDKLIEYTHEVWKVKPRSIYQNLAFELLLDDHLDLVTLQSEAGYGKTFLALASAFFLVLQRKLYEKIYIVKPMVEIGAKMGYLPGDVDEKMEPYIRYLRALVNKLHLLRPVERIFDKNEADHSKFDADKFEILPLAFIRGMNIENAIVIIDETQNLSRMEIRSLLTRMGENVKCYCLGDTRQVDNPYLNESNNALNWIVRKLKGTENYGHLVLKGAKSRGPICDAVLKSGL